MISSFVKKQLIVFFSLAISAVLIIVFVYAQIPTVLGFGQMKISAYFTDGSGIYKDSNVTTRGTVIGKVAEISLTPQGVKVDMSIDDTQEIGSDARASIHSVSAVGEIYVDITSDRAAGPYLEDGSVIPVERTEVPVQIAPVLDKVTRFIGSFPEAGINTFLDEGSKAFQNLGPDLRTLVESAENLVMSADQHYAQTHLLIETVGPLLDTQVVNNYGQNIQAYFEDLAHFTGVFRENEKHFRGLLDEDSVGGAASKVEDFLADNENTVPVLTKNLRTVGHLLGVYRDGLEQVLVQYPIVANRLQRFGRSGERGLSVSLVTDVWPGCTEGFKGNELRNPNDFTDKDTPPNMYCKAKQDAQKFVRGARNIPCQEGYKGMRAASIDECFGRRPNQIQGSSGQAPYNPEPFGMPAFPQRTPLDPSDNQRNYQHSSVKGGEPMAPIGAISTAAPVKEESWQSLLTAPLGR